jgi:hypothetical protein
MSRRVKVTGDLSTDKCQLERSTSDAQRQACPGPRTPTRTRYERTGRLSPCGSTGCTLRASTRPQCGET